MNNQEKYKQAFSALQPRGDLMPRQAKPAPRRNWRRGVVAAALCAVMAVTAAAGVRMWNFTVDHDGERQVSMMAEFEAPENAPESLETLYVPQTLPDGAELAAVNMEPEGDHMNWQWRLADGAQLSYEQNTFRLGGVRTRYDVSGLTMEDDVLDTGLQQATRYQMFRPDGTLDSTMLMWCDGAYIYKVYCGSGEFADELQIALVNSLEAISREDCTAAMERYPHTWPGIG